VAPDGTSAQQAVDAWRARGTTIDTDGRRVFMVDVPAQHDTGLAPMFVLHGFTTCSYDWVHVLPEFSRDRRVVLLDFPGFGLSDKPDVRYSIRLYADAAVAVARAAGLERVVLVTHDMGDTVGGELLARELEGTLPFSVERRLLTNGSIYIEMAQLTAGQQMLLAADDAPFDLADLGLDPRQGFCSGVAGTFSPSHPASDDEQEAQWLFASHADGHKLLARTIRYIEDRRAEETRFTGAIERHPSPLGVVWGRLDPVAVHAMTDRLLAARPDAILRTLDDVGHYPMVEAPGPFAAACSELLAKDA
jgi:pimeloyl-ACP methyl ester carboxylesterase